MVSGHVLAHVLLTVSDSLCDRDSPWRPSIVGCGARWWKAANGTSECVAAAGTHAEDDRMRAAVRSVLDDAGWVDEVRSESRGGSALFLCCSMFTAAEHSRRGDFERVLEHVAGRAQSRCLSADEHSVLTGPALPGALRRELLGMIRGRLAVDTCVGT